MKIKCGTDIIEISRIRNSIEDIGENFINKIFTPKEIEYCESKGEQKYQHYAVRFAAKEATYKAVSERLSDKYELLWTDYEVTKLENGKPNMKIKNENLVDKIESIDISLSHCKEYAVANVCIIFIQ